MGEGQITFQKTFNFNNDDWGFSVQQTTDGGYIIVGDARLNGNQTGDTYLIKTNAYGDSLWTKIFRDSINHGHSVQQTLDGGFIVTGYTMNFPSTNSYVYLIKTDANGDTLW